MSHFAQDDKSYIEAKFLEIIQHMQLTTLETSALRLAITRDDEAVRDALEAFRASLDEPALQAALRLIVERTVQLIRQGEAGFVPDEASEGERAFASPRKGLDESGTVSPRRGENVEIRADPNVKPVEEDEDEDDDVDDDDVDDEDDEDDEDYEDEDYEEQEENDEEEDGEEEEDEYLFPILLKELLSQHILTKVQARALSLRYQASDPRVLSALKTYDRQQDMAELIRSLKRVAELAVTHGVV